VRVAGLGVFSGVCVATLVLLAGPASAHASLIGASPAPGETLAGPPRTVELDFDEPVEAVFNAVHVYDVKAKRVDTGRIDLAKGRQTVLVRMRNAPASETGTFTITWKVISGDGHVTSGSFQYYVGRPSSQAAIAVPIASGPSTFVSVLAWLARFAWYFALALIAGVVVVRRWLWTPMLRRAGIIDDAPPRDVSAPIVPVPAARSLSAAVPGDDTAPGSVHATFVDTSDAALRWSWPVLAVSALLLLWTEAALVSNGSLWSAANPSVLRELLGTEFGTAWKVEALAVVLLLAPLAVIIQHRPRFGLDEASAPAAAIAVVFVACLGTALGGHARQAAHPAVTVLAMAVHVAGAAAWVGGLVAITVLAVPAWAHLDRATRPRVAAGLVRSFGLLALGAVVALALSGLVLAFAELADVSDLWHTTYGRVLLVKLVLFATALGFAAWHRFVSEPRLAHANETASQTSGDTAGDELRRFETTSLIESSVLVAVLVVAAVLVALVPGRAIADRAQGPAEGNLRIGAYQAAVAVAPAFLGEGQVHLTFTTRRGAPAGDVTRATVTMRESSGRTQTVPLQLLSPGHFSGSVRLTVPGRDEVRITIPRTAASAAGAATFGFNVRAVGLAPAPRS
jgi:copper transport protein